MSYSVIIPSRTPSNLFPCLLAIRENEPELPPENIIVIDDSDEQLSAIARACCASGISWVAGKKPFIFSRACNMGIHAAGCNDVILVNDDALLKTPGGFSLLSKAAEENPEYGVISAACNWSGNLNQLPRPGGTLRDEQRMVCFIAAYIPRATFDKIGLLDEDFACYSHQDDDYCLRARRAGLKIGVFDGCLIDHKTLQSTFRKPGGTGELATGDRIFRAKWGAGNRDL